MPRTPRPFSCKVLTLGRQFYAGDVIGAEFPALDGMVGVLAQRAPMVSLLGYGPLSLQTPQGPPQEFFVAGGFAQVRQNTMTILSFECERLDEIDPEEAYDRIEQAMRLPRQPPDAAQRRQWALKLARARFNLVQEHRRRKGLAVVGFHD